MRIEAETDPALIAAAVKRTLDFAVAEILRDTDVRRRQQQAATILATLDLAAVELQQAAREFHPDDTLAALDAAHSEQVQRDANG